MDQQNVGSKRSAPGAGGKIAAKSHETAEQLKEAVVGQAHQLRETARSTQDHTSHRIRSLAEQLRTASDNLRQEDPLTAGLIERASRGIEDVAGYVRSTSPQSLVRDAERLARRQPALFFGSALLLGLAAGRFLKSSAPHGSFEGRGEDDESDAGGPLARPQDRESGFFPSNERETGGSQLYRDNVDATFARDSGDAMPARRETMPRPPAQREGNEAPGRTAGRGERS
jgi:hypothetical protein